MAAECWSTVWTELMFVERLMTNHRWLSTLVVAPMIALTAACAGDPVASAHRHGDKGDLYAAQQRFKEAVIEYSNAIQLQPEWAAAHYKRARAYMSLGDPVHAYQSFARVADLEPSNIDAQLQAAALLISGGEFEAAQLRATIALQHDPDDVRAHIVLGNALAGLKDLRRAIAQMEQAIALDPSNASAWSTLGILQGREGDADRARAALTRAVALDPSSVEARLALADFLWARGDIAEVERLLRDALEVSPNHPLVHQALALLYVRTGRSSDAEPHFKALAQRDDNGRLGLADLYLGLNRRDDAAHVLRSLTTSADDTIARAARLRLIGLDFAEGRKADAYRAADALIAEKSHRIDARLAKARMLLQDGRAHEAASEVGAALKSEAGSAEGQYLAGLSALAERRTEDAELAFEQVVALNPRATAAYLQLARLRLARGDAGRALGAAEQAASLAPRDQAATLLKVRALGARGDLLSARRELETAIARDPNASALRLELGRVSLQQHDVGGARRAFEAALHTELTDDARAGLVATELTAGHVAAARARVDSWLAGSPRDTRLRILSAQVLMAAHRPEDAARVLEEIIAADPSQLDAYTLLGQLHAARGQLDQAIVAYEAGASRSTSPGAALTMVAMLQEVRGDRAAAQAAYERALAANPRNGAAANNLAWLYAEAGRFEEALRLATTAQDMLPGRPEPHDTLGWMYYRQARSENAIAAFEQALRRAPEKGLYHYHLGLARLQAGQSGQGRSALQRALALGLPGAERDGAHAALASTEVAADATTVIRH
ncbi:MAG: tetratricopeptide repeat protein [Vicinamibacterales bacterium]